MTPRNANPQPTAEAGALPLSHLYLSLTEGDKSTWPHDGYTVPSPSGKSREEGFPPTGVSQRILPLDTIHQVFLEAIPLGLQVVRLGGDEPLLYPHIDTLFQWLVDSGLAVTVETTGRGLTAERAAQLAHLPRCRVSIRLDGADSTTHDALHETSGSYDVAVLAVRLLSNSGLPPQVVFAIDRRNATQLSNMVRLAENLGAESLRIIYPLPESLAARKNGSTMLLPGSGAGQKALRVEELIAFGRKVERDYANKTHLRLIFNQPPVFRGLYPQSSVEGQGSCEILHTLGILVNGTYTLCGSDHPRAEDLPGLLLGIAGRDSLARIWREHPILQTLRAGLPDRLEGICKHCIMKRACLGYCAEENYRLNGAFWGPYWFCAAAERAGLFPAGRRIENHW